MGKQAQHRIMFFSVGGCNSNLHFIKKAWPKNIECSIQIIFPKLAKFNSIFFHNIMPLSPLDLEQQWLDMFYDIGTESRHYGVIQEDSIKYCFKYSQQVWLTQHFYSPLDLSERASIIRLSYTLSGLNTNWIVFGVLWISFKSLTWLQKLLSMSKSAGPRGPDMPGNRSLIPDPKYPPDWVARSWN